MQSSSIAGVLFTFGFLLLFFILCREIVCWYWKINDGLKTMTEIRDLLQQQVIWAKQHTPDNGKIICHNCGVENHSFTRICTSCNIDLKK